MALAIDQEMQKLDLLNSLTEEDEKEIGPDIIDFVANRLPSDWKQFAVGLMSDHLSDADIEQIDLDNRTVYEKARAMLIRWKNTNNIPVTKAMLKLQLHSMRRNDIISELTEGDSGNVRENQIKSRIPERRQQQPAAGVLTVCDLRLKDINKLKYKLDPSYGSGINNWAQLAQEIIGNDQELTPKIKDLELHYCGGGNPALKFFQSLAARYPKLTVQRFQKTARSLNRNDIVVKIDELILDKNQRLSSIEPGVKNLLASLLNTNIPGINSWDMFADEYGYRYTEIATMKAAIKEEGSYSPTNKLFQLFRESKPRLTLEEIRAACRKLSRNDVALVFDEIERELKELHNIR